MKKIKLEEITFITKGDPNEKGALIQHDDGIQFGMAFFETILIRESPIWLEEHLMRLNQSLAAFGILRQLDKDLVESFVKCQNLKHTALKILISEKNAVFTTRALSYTEAQYQSGWKLKIAHGRRSSNGLLVRHKSSNYGENILNLKLALNEGFDDCFFLNELGNVTETAIGNLFIVERGKVITPPVSDGLLPGIVRDKLMASFQIKEESIPIERLMRCDGAFMTNSLVGAIHISLVDTVTLAGSIKIDEIRDFILTQELL